MRSNDRQSVEDVANGLVYALQAHRVSDSLASPAQETCRVVVEDALVIIVDDIGSYTIMCTPDEITALAVGFVFSEGLISGVDDIVMLYRCDDDPGVVSMRLADPAQAQGSERNLIVVSSCGMCGGRQAVEQLLSGIPLVGDSLRVSRELLLGAAAEMRARQVVFSQTGGSHAAGIFRADGHLIAFGEDLGRHNALDKAIGQCVLARQSTEGCGAVSSGRVSFELAAKAARDGFAAVPQRLERAARTLGASPCRVLFTIALAMAWRSILSGTIMMWARGISEFGAVIIIAYHPMTTPVLIFQRFNDYGLSYARAAALVLIAICVVVFVALRFVATEPRNRDTQNA